MSAPGAKLWGGRFERPPDEGFYEFQKSLPFDRRLLPYELAADRAWAHALELAGLLTAAECTEIVGALDQIAARVEADSTWIGQSAAEDVHHLVELALAELIGSTAWKLHTGRSRNDLVATEFRLFIKDAVRAAHEAVAALIAAILEHAEKHPNVPMPGMTHLQHAQPILYAHYLLAHVEGYFRDLERLAAAAQAADQCPLGSAALAGTAYPIDRLELARELGFARITANSLDAVSARDFALDYLYAVSVLATHLSRLAEDMVLFASAEFGFVTPGDEYATGSSIMPQKKNPDAWELLRGKTARSVSALFGLFVTLKGLPTGYQRDLQEDKEPLFAAHDQVLATVRVAAGAVRTMRVNEARLREAVSDPGLLATEAADYLVRRGLPFRQAHDVVGRLVREGERLGVNWTTLSLDQLRAFSPLFDESVYHALTLESALNARRAQGGTAAANVASAVTACRERLEALA